MRRFCIALLLMLAALLFGATAPALARSSRGKTRTTYTATDKKAKPANNLRRKRRKTAEPEKILDGEIVRVCDGDTADLRTPDGVVTRLRFYGIDAPESSQQFGPEARKFVNAKLFRKRVRVQVRNRDQYGRTVATIFLDGQDFCLALLKAGYVWHYASYCNDPEYARAQQFAQNAGYGLWGEAKRNGYAPIPPWQYRKEHPWRSKSTKE